MYSRHCLLRLLPSGLKRFTLILIDTLVSLQLPTDVIVNTRAKQRLKDTYKSAFEYMDRDRQDLKAVMASLTSTKFTAELQQVSSRQGTASAKKM